MNTTTSSAFATPAMLAALILGCSADGSSSPQSDGSAGSGGIGSNTGGAAGAGMAGGGAGTDVPGTLEGCFEATGDCNSLSGNLDGQTAQSTPWRGRSTNEVFRTIYDNGFLLSFYRDNWQGSDSGPVDYAFLFTPEDSARQGAVYCAGNGSTWQDEQSRFWLTTWKRVGACSATTGGTQVTGCIRD